MTLEAEQNPPPDLIVADPVAVDRMLGYGAETLRRCYQCGTCSVVCPKTPLEDAFPRKEMVWAQWGLEDKLLTDGDAWLCFQCNDCITHCPVDARPGDVMAATRDLQMEEYAVPRFMTRIPRDPRALPLAIALPAVLVGLLVLGAAGFAGGDGVFPKGDVLFGRFLGEGWVDVFVMTLVGVVALLSFLSLRRFWAGLQSTVPAGTERLPLVNALRGTLGDVFSHRDFNDCKTAHPRMWAHMGLFYGFLGLTAATAGAALYTEILPRLGIHHHGDVLSLPIWDPVKIVGNIGGVALLAGLAQTLWVRLRRPEQSGKSAYSDWFFSGLLGLTAVTGFITEILRYAQAGTAAYVAYTVHLVFIFGLFAYFPFSKFSHVMYRTAAMTFARQVGRVRA
ncbi:MAG TPA: quinone-interacting membrane-bound oxidoreductase complex subunit QmoC [Acidimicrobiia bacterium]|nr:quinone-interacting membrane-bound oxidoreductase complex subunit QmoC [Acidimicrobiia bacterium]